MQNSKLTTFTCLVVTTLTVVKTLASLGSQEVQELRNAGSRPDSTNCPQTVQAEIDSTKLEETTLAPPGSVSVVQF